MDVSASLISIFFFKILNNLKPTYGFLYFFCIHTYKYYATSTIIDYLNY